MAIGFSIYLPFLALHSLAAALLAARFRFLPDALAGAGGVGVTLAIAALVRGHGLGSDSRSRSRAASWSRRSGC